MNSGHANCRTNLQPGDKVDYQLLRNHAIKGVTFAAKRSKKDFIKFVNYYNGHVAEINLTGEEKDALKNVHTIWKNMDFNEVNQVSLVQILMKSHLDILCKRLVSLALGPRPKEKQLWTEFMLGMGDWGEKCKEMIMLCTEEEWEYEVGGSEDEDSEDVSTTCTEDEDDEETDEW